MMSMACHCDIHTHKHEEYGGFALQTVVYHAMPPCLYRQPETGGKGG